MSAPTRLLALLTLATLVVAGCGGPDGPPPGTTPMKDLLAAGRAPVEVVAFATAGNPVMPQFNLSIKNVSDAKVTAVQWTAVFTAADGSPVPDGQVDGGYAELGGIPAGETLQGRTGAPQGAARGRLVLRSVLYEALPPGAETNESLRMMTFAKKWTNPAYDKELAGN